MSELLKVIETNGEETAQPYLLRTAGWTEEQYFEEAPEMRFVEFEDGEIIMHSPVNIRHQKLTSFLSFLLRGFADAEELGEVLNGPAVVRLRENLDYEPDVFFIPKELVNQLEEQYFMGAPPLIIEVISPSTRNHDLKTKADNYRKYGVREYWAIDPEQQILYHHLIDSRAASYQMVAHTDGRLESTALTGFWIDVGWLWQAKLPSAMDCLNLILGR